jgi:hypothetical protein
VGRACRRSDGVMYAGSMIVMPDRRMFEGATVQRWSKRPVPAGLHALHRAEPVPGGNRSVPSSFWSSYRHHAGRSGLDITDHPHRSLGNTPFERQALQVRCSNRRECSGTRPHPRCNARRMGLGERGFAAEIAKRTKRRTLRREPAGPGASHSAPIKAAVNRIANIGVRPRFSSLNRLVRRSRVTH